MEEMISLKFIFLAVLICVIFALEKDKDTVTVSLDLKFTKEEGCFFPETLNTTVVKGGSFHSMNLLKMAQETDYIQIVKIDEDKNYQGETTTEDNMDETQLYFDKLGQSVVGVTCNINWEPKYRAKGVISLSTEQSHCLEVEPQTSYYLADKDSNGDTFLYVMYPMDSIPFDTVEADNEFAMENDETHNFREDVTRTHRIKKRDEAPIYIDVLVLVGYSVFERWLSRSSGNSTEAKKIDAREQIQRHFPLLYNSVDRRFKSASPDYNINLVGVFVQENGDSEWLQSIGSRVVYRQQILESVWNWTSSARNLPEHDVVIAYETKYFFADGGGEALSVYSYSSSTCDSTKKAAAVVTYQDVIAVDMGNTAAGIAYGLGSQSDGHSNNCSSSDHYLMSDNRTSLFTTNTYLFSQCSQNSMKTYIDTLIRTSNTSRKCLTERIDPVNVTDVSGKLPGEVYTPDQQCSHNYGSSTFYCHKEILAPRYLLDSGPSDRVSAPDNHLDNDRKLAHTSHKEDPLHDKICDKMYCYFPGSSVCYSRTAAEGTLCGNKKWCLSGECVQSEEAPATDPECIHRDQKQIGILGDETTCPLSVTKTRSDCYSDSYHVSCCVSCNRVRSQNNECLYGDYVRVEPNCTYDQCLTRLNDTVYLSACCETCQNVTTTTPESTIPSTKQMLDSTQKVKTSTSETLYIPPGADNPGLEIGLGVGLSLFLLIALGVTLYCVVKKNKIGPQDPANKENI